MNKGWESGRTPFSLGSGPRSTRFGVKVVRILQRHLRMNSALELGFPRAREEGPREGASSPALGVLGCKGIRRVLVGEDPARA